MMGLGLVLVVPQLRLVVRPVLQTFRLTIGQVLQVGCRGCGADVLGCDSGTVGCEQMRTVVGTGDPTVCWQATAGAAGR
jgi:hypothetical protein